MNNLDKQYQDLLKDILTNGSSKEDRTGTGTISVFGKQIRHNMAEGFPLLTTKKMAFHSMVVELFWFLRGDTNIKYLVDNNCNIWNGDAYKYYLTHHDSEPFVTIDEMGLTKEQFVEKIKSNWAFAKMWGELGPVYGAQWRRWGGVDQIQSLIDGLKNNPSGRRHLVSAWNVGKLDDMVLPPCHYSFQCYVREGKYLSLMWNQRSVDTFLGLPFNIASYGLLLTILAEALDMIPDMLVGSLGDTHLYKNHIQQATIQIERSSFELPSIRIDYEGDLIKDIEHVDVDVVKLENYQSHESIKAPLSN